MFREIMTNHVKLVSTCSETGGKTKTNLITEIIRVSDFCC